MVLTLTSGRWGHLRLRFDLHPQWPRPPWPRKARWLSENCRSTPRSDRVPATAPILPQPVFLRNDRLRRSNLRRLTGLARPSFEVRRECFRPQTKWTWTMVGWIQDLIKRWKETWFFRHNFFCCKISFGNLLNAENEIVFWSFFTFLKR